MMINGNPASMISWANYFMEYGPWLPGTPGGEIDLLPGRNSSYKRQHLLDYGPQLESMLDTEMALHLDLRSRGQKLYLEPKAQMNHVNISAPWAWLTMRFHNGRALAASRARTWSWARRLGYAGGSPLIPLVRLRRIIRQIRKMEGKPPGLMWRVMPALLVSLIVDATGELVGYLTGAGKAHQRLTEADSDRYKTVNTADKALLEA